MKRLLLLIFTIYTRLAFAQDATLIYKNTVNSTVTIETPDGLGSGFFVGENIIATNYHVIKGDTEAYCYTNNSDTKYRIEGYVAVDTSVDLILLKVSGLKRTPIRLSTTPVEIGQKIYAMGSPKGLPATISDGIVSGLRDFDGYKLIQITAPISHGSSGGPVLNSNGELIGVSVASLVDGQNLNFAIPKANLKGLLSNKKLYRISLAELSPPIKVNSYTTSNYSNNANIQPITIGYSIKIGTQEWTTKNLNVSTFRNGDPIPEAKTNEEWSNAGKEGNPAWCYYNNDPTNGEKYGRLYNWYAVNDSRGLAPKGWHIPTYEEWRMLIDYLGGIKVAGKKMRGTNGWDDNAIENGGNGDNSSGLSALPSGWRDDGGQVGLFHGIGEECDFWSATKSEKYNLEAYDCTLGYNYNSVICNNWGVSMGFGYSCHLVMDQ